MEDLLKDRFLLTKEHFSEEAKLSYDPSGDNIIGKVDGWEAVENNVIAFFFGAGWCPACQQFTPLLKDLYRELDERQAPFQVIFISFDKRPEDMEKYYMEEQGDWLAVPFGDPLIDELKKLFNISAVPKLIIVKDDGDIITTKGRKEVQDKGIICFRNWQSVAGIKDGQKKKVLFKMRDEQIETESNKTDNISDNS
ncbi:hypothetical protein KUTeg_017165 [Tegillarca granosa]|uniref:Thioredoxin domain-containing protein n=1 Tax=Tegillarca granosa TaxID=220873 RepID=A0ABQ9EN76_TEGGR|nr:hypothetical protein KUTeg_017165 [Tegillarca granosa]